MQELRNKIVAAGFAQEAVDKMDEAQLRKVALALKLEVQLPHTVKIQDHKGLKYVVTSGYTVPQTNPKDPKTARGLFLRTEAIDQAIADLTAAKGLLGK